MVFLLGILSFLAVGAGLMLLSNATLGVGVVAAGCWLAIIARVAQAHQQHEERMRRKRPHVRTSDAA